ncbi:hypothetical protein [Conyzicola sp.]|uniref:hypothetical protein n=1 Tax=Conyzicola sp. TaxID=1969404 RepID=UPI003988EE04
MKKLTIITTASLLLALTGCSTEPLGLDLVPEFQAVESTPAPLPEPTFDPADLDQNGSVSNFELQVQAAHAVRSVTLVDGTVVDVDPDVPLADNVKASVVMAIAPAFSVLLTFDRPDGSSRAIFAAVDAQAASLGRELVVVAPAKSAQGVNGAAVRAYVIIASGKDQGLTLSDESQATQIAFAENYASARNCDVIVLP